MPSDDQPGPTDCECRCDAPGWRTSPRPGVGDPMRCLWIRPFSACLSSDLSVVVAGTGLAHQLA